VLRSQLVMAHVGLRNPVIYLRCCPSGMLRSVDGCAVSGAIKRNLPYREV